MGLGRSSFPVAAEVGDVVVGGGAGPGLGLWLWGEGGARLRKRNWVCGHAKGEAPGSEPSWEGCGTVTRWTVPKPTGRGGPRAGDGPLSALLGASRGGWDGVGLGWAPGSALQLAAQVVPVQVVCGRCWRLDNVGAGVT